SDPVPPPLGRAPRPCQKSTRERTRCRSQTWPAVATEWGFMTAATTTPRPSGASYRYLVVGLLAVVYTFNFMDRQIVSILAEPIRKDLGFSDTQLGALGGLTFALFYTTFGIPVAWLSDRFKRVWIMAAACSI